MIIKNANVFTREFRFLKKDIFIRDGHFLAEPPADTNETEEIIDAEGCYAIPGLTDIHFHGCGGYDFCDGTKEALDAITAYEGANGITQIVPATMTLSEDRLTSIMENARNYKKTLGAELVGINMEGPYLSLAKKGAQNPEYLHKPDVDMFRRLQAASGGLIRFACIAPEQEGSFSFIERLKDEVIISIAHTTAGYDTANAALKAGASHITHLYNAMPPFLHRAPGVVGAAFDNAHTDVELITDGIHIHPSVVRATFRLFGGDRVILISDSMMATGLSDGAYSLGGQAVTVVGSRATLSDGTIAGSATNLMDCVRRAVRDMHIPLAQAVRAAAVNSARSAGIYDKYGSITPGKVANLVLLDKDLNLVRVILRGH